ncbi:MAG: exodeoxyribonuclease VII small subunit [Bacteroidaceae bacterium]|nr:exodeoxyribonuclease VII small subunit [Bacteroidaceae bacterium]
MEGKEKEITYESAKERLEAITSELEAGNVHIDLLAKRLKEAQELLRFCKDQLTKAEEEVTKLLEEQ